MPPATRPAVAHNVSAAALASAVLLRGNDGNNTLTGSKFNDTLNGNLGADTLMGGLGDDTYLYELSGDTDSLVPLSTAKDKITDSGGSDTVQFASTAANDILVLTSVTGVEKYILEEGTVSIGFDLSALAATAAANITGNDGDNSLTGTKGNDTIDGGLGVDTVAAAWAGHHYCVGSTRWTHRRLPGHGKTTQAHRRGSIFIDPRLHRRSTGARRANRITSSTLPNGSRCPYPPFLGLSVVAATLGQPTPSSQRKSDEFFPGLARTTIEGGRRRHTPGSCSARRVRWRSLHRWSAARDYLYATLAGYDVIGRTSRDGVDVGACGLSTAAHRHEMTSRRCTSFQHGQHAVETSSRTLY